jgi:predicted RNA-binding Zn ribbon-like protein
MPAERPFPADWLASGKQADDLDLALLLVNSLDQLDDPPDRLHNLSWLRSAFAAVGHAALGAQLDDADLPALRELRERLRPAFSSDDAAVVSATLNPLLAAAPGPTLVADATARGGVRLEVGHGLEGVPALAARLPTAVAEYVAANGPGRLGTCHSDPCRCAFVDRTRAGTRRYCCDYCNDRAASRAYRRRRKATSS